MATCVHKTQLGLAASCCGTHGSTGGDCTQPAVSVFFPPPPRTQLLPLRALLGLVLSPIEPCSGQVGAAAKQWHRQAAPGASHLQAGGDIEENFGANRKSCYKPTCFTAGALGSLHNTCHGQVHFVSRCLVTLKQPLQEGGGEELCVLGSGLAWRRGQAQTTSASFLCQMS